MTNLEIIEDGGTYPRAAFIAEIERQGFVKGGMTGTSREYVRAGENGRRPDAWLIGQGMADHFPPKEIDLDLTVTLTD